MAGYEEFEAGRSPKAKTGEAEMREDRIKVTGEGPRWIRLDGDPMQHRLDGLWFAASYRQCAEEAGITQVYDVIEKQVASADRPDAPSKCRLSARAVGKRRLQNDVRYDGGPLPQRHKRQKRKRTGS